MKQIVYTKVLATIENIIVNDLCVEVEFRIHNNKAIILCDYS